MRDPIRPGQVGAGSHPQRSGPREIRGTPSPGAPGRTAPQCCGCPLVEAPPRAANRRAAPSAGRGAEGGRCAMRGSPRGSAVAPWSSGKERAGQCCAGRAARRTPRGTPLFGEGRARPRGTRRSRVRARSAARPMKRERFEGQSRELATFPVGGPRDGLWEAVEGCDTRDSAVRRSESSAHPPRPPVPAGCGTKRGWAGPGRAAAPLTEGAL